MEMLMHYPDFQYQMTGFPNQTECSYLDSLPVTAKDIATETESDPVLAKVKHHVLSGWPKYIPEEALQPYMKRKFDLTVEDGCVLWGFKVVIPERLQSRLLSE